ncbi:hypothetical protein FRB94_000368 [Tulasnella sp. JGI-2019a]|nr:hypothetical protein FRB94_000368 [Tulasnella sp. JGI-2019a]
MSIDQGIEMPLIHSVLDQFSASSTGNDVLQRGMDITHENHMDIDTDTPMPDTTEVASTVTGFESSSLQPGGSVVPPGNTPANDSPRFTLSSSDSHLISIERRVALGYHSDMYQGIYTPTKLKLAMKCPRILEAGTIQAVDVKRRYEREVKTWSSLKHDNVLPFFGVVEISSNTYLMAPWVTHGDLSGFLSARLKCLADPSFGQDSVSVEKRAAFLIFDEAATIHGIASGLAYLHACGVIHGDIKAANVLLDDTLNPLLGDFGLAKKDDLKATSPGMKGSGTTMWKSPGLHNGESRTTKTDIYALGMTIVEVLTGRVPFPHLRTSFKVCVAISQGHRPPFEPLSRHGKDFRPLWEQAASCWQQEPDKRPAAAQVMACIAPLRFTVSPRHTQMEADSYVIPSVVEEVDRQNNTLRGDQSIPGGFRDGSQREGNVTAYETQSGQSTGEKNHTRNSLIEALSIYKELGDRSMIAHCMKSLGDIKQSQGDYDSACILLQEAAVIYEELGYRNMMAHCVTSVGEIKETQEHYGDACISLNAAATIYKAIGDQSRMAHCLKSVGTIKESQGDYDDACASLSEAHVVFTRLGDRSTTAQCLKSIGEIKGTQGHYDDAMTLLGESYGISK